MRATRQLSIASVPGLVAGVLCAFVLPWSAATLAGWIVAVGIYLALAWVPIWKLSSREAGRVATRKDPNRGLTDLLLVAASVVSVAGVGFTLVRATDDNGASEAGLLALAVGGLMLAWALVHTVFALTYARLYFAEGGGISFNEDDPPVFSDFAYLAATIGMTFQVSDTNIMSKPIRRAALHHALISYVFGAVLLAMTVNVGASLVH